MLAKGSRDCTNCVAFSIIRPSLEAPINPEPQWNTRKLTLSNQSQLLLSSLENLIFDLRLPCEKLDHPHDVDVYVHVQQYVEKILTYPDILWDTVWTRSSVYNIERLWDKASLISVQNLHISFSLFVWSWWVYWEVPALVERQPWLEHPAVSYKMQLEQE